MNVIALIELGDENTAFGVIFPDIPGCTSAGDTLDQALDNAKTALSFFLEFNQIQTPPLKLLSEVEIPETFHNVKYELTYINVDHKPNKDGVNKTNVSLDSDLIDAIDDHLFDNPQYKSREGFLTEVAKQRLQEEGI